MSKYIDADEIVKKLREQIGTDYLDDYDRGWNAGLHVAISHIEEYPADVHETLNDIKAIINDCDEVQESGESQYSKECEKLFAYDKIREVVMENE